MDLGIEFFDVVRTLLNISIASNHFKSRGARCLKPSRILVVFVQMPLKFASVNKWSVEGPSIVLLGGGNAVSILASLPSETEENESGKIGGA